MFSVVIIHSIYVREHTVSQCHATRAELASTAEERLPSTGYAVEELFLAVAMKARSVSHGENAIRFVTLAAKCVKLYCASCIHSSTTLAGSDAGDGV